MGRDRRGRGPHRVAAGPAAGASPRPLSPLVEVDAGPPRLRRGRRCVSGCLPPRLPRAEGARAGAPSRERAPDRSLLFDHKLPTKRGFSSSGVPGSLSFPLDLKDHTGASDELPAPAGRTRGPPVRRGMPAPGDGCSRVSASGSVRVSVPPGAGRGRIAGRAAGPERHPHALVRLHVASRCDLRPRRSESDQAERPRVSRHGVAGLVMPCTGNVLLSNVLRREWRGSSRWRSPRGGIATYASSSVH